MPRGEAAAAAAAVATVATLAVAEVDGIAVCAGWKITSRPVVVAGTAAATVPAAAAAPAQAVAHVLVEVAAAAALAVWGYGEWGQDYGGGGGGGGGVRSGGLGTMPAASTFAERQIGRQEADQRLQQQLAAARRQAEQLRASNVRLQQQLVGRGGNGGTAEDAEEDMECDDSADTMSEEERHRRVETLRNGLPYIELQFGADSPEMENAKNDIAA